MKERPIPFSAPMVRPVLDDTKTQTRRVLKAEPPPGAQRVIRPFRDERLQWAATDPHDMEQGQLVLGDAPRCPYGEPGDRLWVREAWRVGKGYDGAPGSAFTSPLIWYEAERTGPVDERAGRYRHGRFMPRWASRITLEVTDVRVERLQSISADDAEAEGARAAHWNAYSARLDFRSIWESINGRGSWDANPWVWAVSFRRLP